MDKKPWAPLYHHKLPDRGYFPFGAVNLNKITEGTMTIATPKDATGIDSTKALSVNKLEANVAKRVATGA